MWDRYHTVSSLEDALEAVHKNERILAGLRSNCEGFLNAIRDSRRSSKARSALTKTMKMYEGLAETYRGDPKEGIYKSLFITIRDLMNKYRLEEYKFKKATKVKAKAEKAQTKRQEDE